MTNVEPLMTLKQMRKRRRATMQEVADKLGITRQWYSDLEKSPSKMTLAQAREVCAFLRCDVADISNFFGEESK